MASMPRLSETWVYPDRSPRRLGHNLITHWNHMYRVALVDWKGAHLRLVIIGAVAAFLGAVDIFGEISSGGDTTSIGFSGLLDASMASILQWLISLGLWAWFFTGLWLMFPLVRSQMALLAGAWAALALALASALAHAPSFPSGGSFSGFMGVGLAILLLMFGLTMFNRAVGDTVNLHINAAHHSEDARKMEEARIDHDLLGWRSLLIIWGMCALLATWLGGRYVASRPTGGMLNILGHLLFTFSAVLTMVTILWYPQLMLGTSTTGLSTDKAREIDEEKAAAKRGDGAACPDCWAAAPMTRSEDGDISTPCPKETCKGVVVVGMECEYCGTKAPVEHTCTACGTVTAAIDLFPTTDAW